MEPGRWQRIQALFDGALEQAEDKRRSWLARACADDPSLLAEVEALLAADQADDVLATRISRSVESELRVVRLEPGQQVGAYAIDRLLATGGMGSVYLARRSDQTYEQVVVIKIVALPLSDELHTRFRRERQILADLSHPFIARLLDGGTLPGGEPYLVLEYVRGCDIATWCERQRLGLTARLALFMQVCQAVQFAHANLVVHRDIKPANVLIDEAGTPHLLDFGIASLLEAGGSSEAQAMADNRLSSDYASPEQRRGQAVTTASDVYSLGALLYRLLTSQAPRFDSPHPPSVFSACRSLTRDQPVIVADLDAIVDKALAQEPAERYATPQALIEDLERLQSLRPIRARPVGRLGQFGRAARRNPMLSATIGLSGLLVTGFVVSVSILAIYLDRERNRALVATATAEQVADFAFGLFEGADPEISRNETPSARQLLDRGTARIQGSLDGQDPIRARLLHRMGKAYQGLGEYEQARALLATALEQLDANDEALRWTLLVDLGDLERILGLHAGAIERLEAVIAGLAHRQAFPAQLASAYNNLGILATEQEQYERAETLARQALAIKLPDDSHREVLHDRYRHNLARAMGRQGRHDEAIALLEEVIASKRLTLGEPHPSIMRSMEVVAGNHRRRGDLDGAAAAYDLVLAQVRDIYGEFSTYEARVNNQLGNVHHDRGAYAQAEQAYQRALVFHDARPDASPVTHAHVVNNLASLYEDRGDLGRAEPLFRRSLSMRRELVDDDNLLVLHARSNLARVLTKQAQLAEAEQLLDKVAATLARHFPDNQLRQLQLDWQLALIKLARDDAGRGSIEMQDVVDRLEAEHPERVALRASAVLDAARFDLQLGEFDRAIARTDQALTLLRDLRPADHPDQLRASVLRAEALAAQGDPVAAAAAVQTHWPALVERFCPDSAVITTAGRLMSAE
ncbi:MAG: hypothetical protein EA370_04105 [Wenzhouxiangella sp.]|nr:MAG: hypothetical protein EA370_04105 [Wenzhouxiangella sp.]